MENTSSIIKSLVENCAGEMVPRTYVQIPEELLAHSEHIVLNNQWMAMFLTQLEKMDRQGDLR